MRAPGNSARHCDAMVKAIEETRVNLGGRAEPSRTGPGEHQIDRDEQNTPSADFQD